MSFVPSIANTDISIRENGAAAHTRQEYRQHVLLQATAPFLCTLFEVFFVFPFHSCFARWLPPFNEPTPRPLQLPPTKSSKHIGKTFYSTFPQ